MTTTAETGRFDAPFLPDEIKEEMCRGLLAEFGVTKISTREPDGELIHCCPMPWHPEKNPSASLNYKKLTFKCISGETLVKTIDGERPIKDLAGGRATLLDGNGKWVDAPVREFGQERLYRVTLSRNGVRKEVYTTADHRWYRRANGSFQKGKGVDLIETTTADLRPKQRIPSVWAMTRTGRTSISRTGVQAGFVFGDGTRTEHGSVAYFCGPKDEALLPWFEPLPVIRRADRAEVREGLPRSWRSLPSLDEGQSYLWGWLAGYFAADGCVADNGHATLACADRSTLEFVTAVCDRLGIATYTLGSRSRVGRSGDGPAVEATEIHSLSFRGSTLTPEFFLIPLHRERYETAMATRRYERTHWWVTSVEETDRFETVYCAEVPTTNSFVLEGNILTGNCLGCQASGGLLWFIGVCRGTDGRQARDWVETRSGLGGADGFDLPALLHLIDAVYNAKDTTPPPIPTFAERALDQWKGIHPTLTDGVPDLGIAGRGIPEENLVAMRVGYAPEYPMGKDEHDNWITAERHVFPHFWKGKLVGWQSRRVWDDGTEKYKSTPDFPKDRTLYNHAPTKNRTAVVVESPASVLRHLHHLPMVSTFGANITASQIRLLAEYERVIWWPDNDKAGWKATLGWSGKGDGSEEVILGPVPGMDFHPGIERLAPYTAVEVVDSPWAADAAEMDDKTADDLVANAVPLAVWTPPKTLRCWLCKGEHDGACP